MGELLSDLVLIKPNELSKHYSVYVDFHLHYLMDTNSVTNDLKKKTSQEPSPKNPVGGKIDGDAHSNDYKLFSQQILLRNPPDEPRKYTTFLIIATLLAIATRLYRIDYPAEVVFDEVHFGKFASYYLEGRFFFDLHPPFGKMIYYFLGWLVGYDGSFKFDHIEMSYLDTGTATPPPYILYRTFNAILGALVVPVVFLILKQLNLRAVTCLFGSLLVTFDTAQVTQTRFIFLDSSLLLSIACAFYCYLRFYKIQVVREMSFSRRWYLWLILTGISLSCCISIKYVGILTYFSIGFGVVCNLWDMFDYRYSLSPRVLMRHFMQRLNYLVMLPFLIYLFWFYKQFELLKYTSEESSYMSELFKDSLAYPPVSDFQKPYLLNYYDIVAVRHDVTGVFLSSGGDGCLDAYGSRENSTLDYWEVLPLDENPKYWGQNVRLNDHVRFKHVVTGTYLASDSASAPVTSWMKRITTTTNETLSDFLAETEFQLLPLREVDKDHPITINSTVFRILNVQQDTTLWVQKNNTIGENLEIAGNPNKKNTNYYNNDWKIDRIINVAPDRPYRPDVVTSVPFFTKWSELQTAMFMLNNRLSPDHPFASHPLTWPLSERGVLYWTGPTERKQIYLIGNIPGWIFQTLTLALYVLIVALDIVSRKRNLGLFDADTQSRLYGPLLLLAVSWALHYFPFYLMTRQKFLHHYLPAHMLLSLFTAGFWETLFSNKIGRKCTTQQVSRRLWCFFALIIILVIAFFVYFMPIVYGFVGLTPSEVRGREWLNIVLDFDR